MKRSRCSRVSRERVSVNQTCRQLICNLIRTVEEIVKKRWWFILPGQERFLEKVTKTEWLWSQALNILNRVLPVATQAEHGGMKGSRMRHSALGTQGSKNEQWKIREGIWRWEGVSCRLRSEFWVENGTSWGNGTLVRSHMARGHMIEVKRSTSPSRGSFRIKKLLKMWMRHTHTHTHLSLTYVITQKNLGQDTHRGLWSLSSFHLTPSFPTKVCSSKQPSFVHPLDLGVPRWNMVWPWMAKPRKEVQTSSEIEFGAIGTGNYEVLGIQSLVQMGQWVHRDQVGTVAPWLLLQEKGMVCSVMRPGPVTTVWKRPSPPKKTFFAPGISTKSM